MWACTQEQDQICLSTRHNFWTHQALHFFTARLRAVTEHYFWTDKHLFLSKRQGHSMRWCYQLLCPVLNLCLHSHNIHSFYTHNIHSNQKTYGSYYCTYLHIKWHTWDICTSLFSKSYLHIKLWYVYIYAMPQLVVHTNVYALLVLTSTEVQSWSLFVNHTADSGSNPLYSQLQV